MIVPASVGWTAMAVIRPVSSCPTFAEPIGLANVGLKRGPIAVQAGALWRTETDPRLSEAAFFSFARSFSTASAARR
jgi:hypothetical protein